MQIRLANLLNKAQESAQSARPYARKFRLYGESIIYHDMFIAPELMVGNGKSDTYLLVVATADRGLCGAFNSNIVKLATLEINELIKQGKQLKKKKII